MSDPADTLPAPAVARREDVMGMPVEVELHDEVAAPAVDEVFAWLRRVDATFSTYRPDSEISRIARGELAERDASANVRRVLERCEALRAQTGGYFDARAGGVLDPSGLVKGWAVERAARLLEVAGARNFCLYAGGDVVVRGRPACGVRWRIGIQHPLRGDRVAAVLESERLAVATSGEYARGAHILDPHTGAPPAGVLSVTIAGPDLGTADAYATAAFAMGAGGPEWTRAIAPYEAMTVLADERVLLTPGFERLRDLAAA
ncbi:MAG: FAD:protein transferase [Solirubrobacteraceae bacterium]|jgi:thiamine biosynthesis lipoprotein|nr:FAD:protein transferase [Solirubrobacteraceae bacterium]